MNEERVNLTSQDIGLSTILLTKIGNNGKLFQMPTPQDQPLDSIRVSVSEAARLFGVNSRTVRRAISTGEVRYIVVRGRYKIHFESLLRWSQKQVTVRNKRDSKGIGQWVDQWKINNPKYSPRKPGTET
ncbi:helix-turn-helix domain-containing protein [Patescibacteria group bacterium]|nr:helix-turn-helix domain-containing protein [Patescibacteria group bacterium]